VSLALRLPADLARRRVKPRSFQPIIALAGGLVAVSGLILCMAALLGYPPGLSGVVYFALGAMLSVIGSLVALRAVFVSFRRL
jgi:hypothetical protein